MITKDNIKSIMPLASASNIEKYCQPLNEAMERFDINTPKRIQAFLAQVAHESQSFLYSKELASGQAYEGRKDLGNINPGDGIKFKGRGLIQITGRFNYEKLSTVFGQDFINHPELLEGPVWASMSASWFWKIKGLNEIADHEDFLLITKRINGGLNGLADRHEFYERAKEVIT